MNKYKSLSLAISLAASLLATACEVGQIDNDESAPGTIDQLAAVVQDRYLVLLEEGTSSSSMLSEMQALDLKSSEQLKGINGFVFNGSPEAAETLAYLPGVKLVEPDQIIFADLPTRQSKPGFCEFIPDHELCSDDDDDGGDGDGGEKPAICEFIPDHASCGDGSTEPPEQQITPWGVIAVGGVGDSGGRTAWVIDTGIDLDNADLNVDKDRSRSFLDFNPSPGDQAGHGTHVAGTIGAIDNEIGVVGVAPGVSLVSLRVLDQDGRGSTVNIVKALDHLTQNGSPGDVANLSLGAPGYSETMDEAVKSAAAKGIHIVVAAGNNREDSSNYTPASIDGENIYTIAAVGSGECLASFSNFGAPVDFSAPGVGIESTKMGGGTHSLDGTSMAAPHVAGVLLTGRLTGGDSRCDSANDTNNKFQVAHRAE